jgi:5'-phosphate synthase pdxT subunit
MRPDGRPPGDQLSSAPPEAAGGPRKRVGVLALQGDFEAHRRALERAGAEAVEIRGAEDLGRLDGLILPGGESTTMLRVMKDEGLVEPLREFASHKPVFGTCAGAILLAGEVSNPAQESLGLMDISVERNAYGRQLNSCVARLVPEEDFIRKTEPGEVEAVFIRAPVIRRVAPDARVFLYYQGDPVLVLQGRHLAATFHPELTSDARIHRLFVESLGPLTQ